MESQLGRDRLREFIDLIVSSLDEDVDGEDIAARGCLSRYHFDHLVSAALKEAPGGFRRRLLLERAAWQLGTTQHSLTKVALNSGYQSPEGFNRAFGRAFGQTPGRFRRQPADYRIDAPNGVHFHPPGGLRFPTPTERARHMDFVDRIVQHDIAFTNQLLDQAAQLPAEALDHPLENVGGWWQGDGDRPTLRSLLNEMVFNKENWAASLSGGTPPKNNGNSLEEMKQRYSAAAPAFLAQVQRIKQSGDWDAGFVDALCDPPESFTYGGMLAHVATFSAYRRTATALAFRQLGVDVGIGDPIEWERNHA